MNGIYQRAFRRWHSTIFKKSYVLWNGILYAKDCSCGARLISISIKLNTEPLPDNFHMRNGYVLSSLKAWFALKCSPNDCRERHKSMQCIDHELGYALNRNDLQTLFCSNQLLGVQLLILEYLQWSTQPDGIIAADQTFHPSTQKLVYVMWGMCRSKNRHSVDIGQRAQNVLTILCAHS